MRARGSRHHRAKGNPAFIISELEPGTAGSMISEGRGEFDAFELFSSHPNKFI
jgi:hypothetical protein